MSDIRINSFSNATRAGKTRKGKGHKVDNGPKDKFTHVSGNDKISPEAIDKFWKEAKNAKEAIKLHSRFRPTPLVNDNTAGWQTSLVGQGGTNCFMKVPLEDDRKTLVIPLQNCGGGNYGKTVVVDSEKGVVDMPDVKPFGDAQGLRYEKSADGRKTYIFNWNSTKIEEFDGNLKKTNTIDLLSIDKDLEKIQKFAPASSGHYVFVSKKNFGSGVFMALDPKTGKARWSKDFESTFVNDVKEGPDGNIYLVMGGFRETKSSIQVFSPGGKKLKEFTGTDDPGHLTFMDDGTVLVADDRSLKRLDLKIKGSGKKKRGKELWSVKGDFRNIQVSPDGKSVYAADTKSGFHRSHGLAKVDAKTGNVEWNREKYGESFIDCRVIGDNIHLVTSTEDRKTTKMTILNPDGKEIWEGSTKTVVDEYEIGMKNVVRPDGSFVFGGREDGSLYCMHPKKDGETAAAIKDGLSIDEQIMKKAKETIADQDGPEGRKNSEPAPVVEDHESFIVVGGVRLDKKRDK